MLCTRMTTLAGLLGHLFFSKEPFLVKSVSAKECAQYWLTASRTKPASKSVVW